jgi:hypothetical protein
MRMISDILSLLHIIGIFEGIGNRILYLDVFLTSPSQVSSIWLIYSFYYWSFCIAS